MEWMMWMVLNSLFQSFESLDEEGLQNLGTLIKRCISRVIEATIVKHFCHILHKVTQTQVFPLHQILLYSLKICNRKINSIYMGFFSSSWNNKSHMFANIIMSVSVTMFVSEDLVLVLTHRIFNDCIIIRNFTGVNRLQKRPCHLMWLQSNYRGTFNFNFLNI